MLRVVDLFSGIGSSREALIRAGIPFEVVAVCDIDTKAHEAYEAIYGPTPNLGDISRVHQLPDCDLLFWSAPCTDLSTAGYQKGMKEGSGTRSSLVWEVERLVKTASHRPKWLVMENVADICGPKFLPDFLRLVNRLSDLGYISQWTVLNGCDFGVPQPRKRCFMVSHLGALDPFPPHDPVRGNLRDFLDFSAPKGYDIPPARLTLKGEDGRIILDPDNPKDFIPALEPGEIAAVLTPERLHKRQRGPRCKRDGTAYVLTAMDMHGVAYRQGTGMRIRRLTPLENWRLMGQSDDNYNKVSQLGYSDRQMCKLAGNAIIVPCMEWVLKEMIDNDRP